MILLFMGVLQLLVEQLYIDYTALPINCNNAARALHEEGLNGPLRHIAVVRA